MSRKRLPRLLRNLREEDRKAGILHFIRNQVTPEFKKHCILMGNPLWTHFATMTVYLAEHYDEIFTRDEIAEFNRCAVPRDYTVKDISSRADHAFGPHYRKYYGNIIQDTAWSLRETNGFDDAAYQRLFKKLDKRLQLKHEGETGLTK